MWIAIKRKKKKKKYVEPIRMCCGRVSSTKLQKEIKKMIFKDIKVILV